MTSRTTAEREPVTQPTSHLAKFSCLIQSSHQCPDVYLFNVALGVKIPSCRFTMLLLSLG